MAPHPINSQVMFVYKAQCASPNYCKTNVTCGCTNKMCKMCCIDLGTPCSYDPHSKACCNLTNLVRSVDMASLLQPPTADGFTMVCPNPIFLPLLHPMAIPITVVSSLSLVTVSTMIPTSNLQSAVPSDQPTSSLLSSTHAGAGVMVRGVPATHVQASSSPKHFWKLMSLSWQS